MIIKEKHLLLGVIAFLLLSIFFLSVDSARNKFVAETVIKNWNFSQTELVSLCKIDLNEYMRERRDAQLQDMELLVFGKSDLNLFR